MRTRTNKLNGTCRITVRAAPGSDDARINRYEATDITFCYKRHQAKVAMLLAVMAPFEDEVLIPVVNIDGVGSVRNFGKLGPLVILEEW